MRKCYSGLFNIYTKQYIELSIKLYSILTFNFLHLFRKYIETNLIKRYLTNLLLIEEKVEDAAQL